MRGTPLAVLAMVRALTGLGHTVDLLTYPQGAAVAVDGLTHHRSLRLPVGRVKAGPSPAKLLLDVPFVLEALGRMLFRRPDVVHAVEEAAHLVAPLTRLLRLPLVADVDSSIPDQLRYSGFARRGPLLWAAEALEGGALRGATAVITVCTALSEGVRARAPRARLFQIEDPPLVSAADLPAPGEARALRPGLGLANDAPVVLYTGNFEPYQGVELLLEAAARVPEAQFLFVGGEPAEIARLRVRAAASGARAVFAGKRPPEELPRLIGLSDVLVSPRVLGQNTPFKIYTYLASGRPLVATRIATHTQLLDERLAFLVEPTAEGLAAGLREALRDPVEAERRAQAGLRLIAAEYSPARYAQKVAHAYATVAEAISNKAAAVP